MMSWALGRCSLRVNELTVEISGGTDAAQERGRAEARRAGPHTGLPVHGDANATLRATISLGFTPPYEDNLSG